MLFLMGHKKVFYRIPFLFFNGLSFNLKTFRWKSCLCGDYLSIPARIVFQRFASPSSCRIEFTMSLAIHTVNWVGIVAGTLTTTAFLPQAIQILRSRQTKNISLTMYVMSALGVAIWIYYGLKIESPPLIIFNVINLVLILSILFAKLYWK